MDPAQIGRAAGRMAKRAKPSAKQSSAFVKHVLPAAVKPLHALWHEIIGFVFLAFAGLGVWRIWSHPGEIKPMQLGLVIVFIVVVAAYGVSSILKARRISRS